MTKPLIARSDKRGEVTQWHRGNMGGPPSRAFNHLEADPKFQKLEDQLEEAIEAVRERFAKKFLKYYRKRITEHNFGNHIIKLSCGIGSCGVLAGDRRRPYERIVLLQDMGGRKGSCSALLEEIEQSMDWGWAAYLDGVILNEEA